MRAILGIDAAWTAHNPSGVALIRESGPGVWECVELVSSYQEFLTKGGLETASPQPSIVPVADILLAAEKLAKVEVCLVAADIPLSKQRIAGRRPADDQISRRFGRCGCSAHSPSESRPGKISELIRDGFERAGLPLAVHPQVLPNRALIETYPHPALLALMKVKYRVQYKASKSRTYFPTLNPLERSKQISGKLEGIRGELSRTISSIDFEIPKEPDSLAALKSIEDKIDVLVCSWVGIQVLNGTATVFGDQDASIWLPKDSLDYARPEDWSALLHSGALASKEFVENVDDLPAEDREVFDHA